MEIRNLTPEELTALKAFADEYGRNWKDKLASVYWYNARVWNGHHCLHALRNDPSWGHNGLNKFRFPKQVEPVVEKDELVEALRDCITELKCFTEDAVCDHSVGICYCSFHRALNGATKLVEAHDRSAKWIKELES